MYLIEKITDFFSRAVLVFSGAGFVISLLLNLISVANIRIPSGATVIGVVFIAAFINMVPAGILANAQTWGVKRKEWWNVVYAGCPPHMRQVLNAIPIYFYINFALLFFLGPSKQQQLQFSVSPVEARMFTAGTMAVFGTAFGIYYSWLHREIKGS